MIIIKMKILLILITSTGGNYVADHIPAAGGFKTVRICLARGVFRAGKDAIATAHMVMVMNDDNHFHHRHYYCAFTIRPDLSCILAAASLSVFFIGLDIFVTIFVFLSTIILQCHL